MIGFVFMIVASAISVYTYAKNTVKIHSDIT